MPSYPHKIRIYAGLNDLKNDSCRHFANAFLDVVKRYSFFENINTLGSHCFCGMSVNLESGVYVGMGLSH